MRVAAHVDQLFFSVPGGVGTYIRNLVPALAGRDPSLELTLFHARFETPRPSEPWMDGFAEEEVAGSIRSLYPRWNLPARPALPASIRSADLVHAMSASAVPPARRGQRLVVTVHDLAFDRYPEPVPEGVADACTGSGLRAAVRRADAIVTPSRATAEDVLSRTKVDPAQAPRGPRGRRVAAERRRRRRDPRASEGAPARTSCSSARSSRGRTWCGWSARTGASPRPACRTRWCWPVRSAGTTRA